MAKFSLGGGTGNDKNESSTHPSKRPRMTPSPDPQSSPTCPEYLYNYDEANVERYVVDEEEEDDDVEEEEEEDREGDEWPLTRARVGWGNRVDVEEEEEEDREGDEWPLTPARFGWGNRVDVEEEEEEYREEDEWPLTPAGVGWGNLVGTSGPGSSLSVTLVDLEVLDCSICYEPLSIPVFQCENGHTACSSCCRKLQQRCPACSLPIGYNRCRAIEKVLESVRVPCQNALYGCIETVVYCKKHEHLQSCIYAPCSCPVSGCTFSGSSDQIYQHARRKHTGPFIRFNFNTEFPVFFTSNDKQLILQEEKEGVLFILRNEAEILGKIITVSRLGPSSSKDAHYYEVAAKMEGCNLRMQSVTKNIQSRTGNPSGAFLLIPGDFFGSFHQISLDVCIWSRGVYPADMERGTTAI